MDEEDLMRFVHSITYLYFPFPFPRMSCTTPKSDLPCSVDTMVCADSSGRVWDQGGHCFGCTVQCPPIESSPAPSPKSSPVPSPKPSPIPSPVPSPAPSPKSHPKTPPPKSSPKKPPPSRPPPKSSPKKPPPSRPPPKNLSSPTASPMRSPGPSGRKLHHNSW